MRIIQICELVMLLLFFVSWPTNLRKSIVSRTAKGKSVEFEILVLMGYIFGAVGRFWTWQVKGVFYYATIFYIINGILVAIDIGFYVRNSRLDARRDAGEAVD